MNRRDFSGALAAIGLAALAPVRLGRLHAEAAPFTRATLIDRALRLAAAPYAPPAKVAGALGELGYDA